MCDHENTANCTDPFFEVPARRHRRHRVLMYLPPYRDYPLPDGFGLFVRTDHLARVVLAGGHVRVVRFGLVGAVVFQHVPDLLAQRQELVDLHHFVGRIGRDVLLEAAQKRHRQLEFRVRRRHRLTFQSAWCSLGSAW
jgi:hypothetical protein